jgi:hypothetical protein
MLLLVPQVICVARRIIINNSQTFKSSLVCLVILPLLLALTPRLLEPLFFKYISIEPPFADLPQCSAVLGKSKCSLMMITVDSPDLAPFGEAVAKSFASEKTGRTVSLNSSVKNADEFKDVMFFPDSKEFDTLLKGELKSSFLSSVRISKDPKTGELKTLVASLHSNFNQKIVSSRLDLFLRKHCRHLPAQVYLPGRLVRPDLSFFIPDVINIIRIACPILSIPIICPLVILKSSLGLVVGKERYFERYLRRNGLKFSALILGNMIGSIGVSLLPFYFIFLGQSFVDSYWNNLASLPLWISLWVIMMVSLLTLLIMLRSFSGLVGYFFTVFGISLGTLIATALSVFDISLNSELLYVFKLYQSKTGSNQRLLFFSISLVLTVGRLLFWPLRLPVLILLSIAARSIDPNALYMTRIRINQVGWSHLLNPETFISTIHSCIAYYYKMYLPVFNIKTANLKDLKESIINQSNYLIGLTESVSFNLLWESFLWLTSLLVIYIVTWYLDEVSDSRSPHCGDMMFPLKLSYWIPFPSDPIPGANEPVTVTLPSERTITLEGCKVFENCCEEDRKALLGMSALESAVIGKTGINPSFITDLCSSSPNLYKCPEDISCKHALKLLCTIKGTPYRLFWANVVKHFPGFSNCLSDSISSLSDEEGAILRAILATSGTYHYPILHEPLSLIQENRQSMIEYLKAVSSSTGLAILLDGPMGEEYRSLADPDFKA